MGYYDNDRNNSDYRDLRDSHYGHCDPDAYLRSRGYTCSNGHYTDPDNPTRTGAYISGGQIVMEM